MIPCCSGIRGGEKNSSWITPYSQENGVSGSYGTVTILQSPGPDTARFSGLTNKQIKEKCASLHLQMDNMGPPDQIGYDQCVSDKKAERGETRTETYRNWGEWFACTFMDKCPPAPKEDDNGVKPRPQQAGMDPTFMWVGLVLLFLILVAVGIGALKTKSVQQKVQQ